MADNLIEWICVLAEAKQFKHYKIAYKRSTSYKLFIKDIHKTFP